MKIYELGENGASWFFMMSCFLIVFPGVFHLARWRNKSNDQRGKKATRFREKENFIQRVNAVNAYGRVGSGVRVHIVNEKRTSTVRNRPVHIVRAYFGVYTAFCWILFHELLIVDRFEWIATNKSLAIRTSMFCVRSYIINKK